MRAFWQEFFAGSSEVRIEVEQIFALGECCAMLWVYRWKDGAVLEGHIRGVDIYTVRQGVIAEKLSYVKG